MLSAVAGVVPNFGNCLNMKHLCLLLFVVCLAGCQSKSLVDADKLRRDQKARVRSGSSNIQEQTGEDLGLQKNTGKKKLRLTTAPIDP